MLRVLRGGRLLTVADEHVYGSAVVKTAKVLVFVFLNLHWACCAWAAVMSPAFERSRGLVVPDVAACARLEAACEAACAKPLVFADPLACAACCDEVKGLDWVPLPPERAYGAVFYVAASFLLGLGAVNPTSRPETALATCLSVYGSGLQASVVGAFAVALQGLDGEETAQRAKLHDVATRMAKMHLPWDLHRNPASAPSLAPRNRLSSPERRSIEKPPWRPS